MRLYDRLFGVAQPGAGGADYKLSLHAGSKKVLVAKVEPMLAQCERAARFQFERLGYFVADRKQHAAGAPVFNRAVTLKDSWSKQS